jgi:hypothetical protein
LGPPRLIYYIYRVSLQIHLSVPERDVGIFVLRVLEANHAIRLLCICLSSIVHAPLDSVTCFQLADAVVEVNVLDALPVEARVRVVA